MRKLLSFFAAFIIFCLVSSYANVSDEGTTVNFDNPDSISTDTVAPDSVAIPINKTVNVNESEKKSKS